MRSLRSTRKTADLSNCKPARGAIQDENSNVKMCSKRPKPVGKNGTRSRRPVLADKTNSGSDLNSSPSTSVTEISTKMTMNRPKRTPILPAKFKNHVMSPVAPSQTIIPDFSSTPLIKAKSVRAPPSKLTPSESATVSKSVSRKTIEIPEISPVKTTRANTRSRVANKVTKPAMTVCNKPGKKNIVQICAVSEEKTVCGKRAKKTTAQISKCTEKTETPVLAKCPTKPNTPIKVENNVNKNNMTPIYKKKMIQLDKHTIPTPDRLALYEFDFDPSEEPTKLKKKKVVRKPVNKRKKAKPAVTDGDAALQDLIVQLKKIQEMQKIKILLKKRKAQKAVQNVVQPTEPVIQTARQNDSDKLVQDVSVPQLVDSVPSPISKSRFCYSPRPSSPMDNYDDDVEPPPENSNFANNIADIRNMSCFSDMPVASSSMIQTSAPKPAASPWRVNYDNEVRKWPCNFYVKASMTPSYERDTFHVIGLDDNINKTDQSNTNNVPERSMKYVNDSEKLANWKQTSILSFYEESMKKTAKKRCHPFKNSKEPYNFDELSSPSSIKNSSTEEATPVQVTPEKSPPKVAEKTPSKVVVENPTVDNCFGFDDSSEFDQENVSPAKKPKLPNINAIRGGTKALKNRGILKEINPPVNLPTRATVSEVLKVIAKTKEVIVQDFDEIVEAPIEVEKEVDPVIESFAKDDSDSSNMKENTTAMDSVETSQASLENEMALFEDPVDVDEPKLVHFNKPSRKSYEKKKKPMVTFLKPSVTILDKEISNDNESDYNSDSSSASKEKAKKQVKKKKKKQTAKSKKEEKEVDEWAAGFNSMLEEADDFDLCVE